MWRLVELGVEVEKRPGAEHTVPRQLKLVHGVHVQNMEPGIKKKTADGTVTWSSSNF